MFKELFNKTKTSVATKIQPKTATVKDVHSDFDSATDKLLAQAGAILRQEESADTSEIMKLRLLGFYRIPEVLTTENLIKERDEAEKEIKYVMAYKEKYPNYKFITKKQVLEICKKYGLVLGDTSDFIGSIPAKNRKEIIAFTEVDKEDVVYLEYSRTFRNATEIDYERYKFIQKNEIHTKYNVYPSNTFKIVAQLKDFKLDSNKQIVDYEIRLIDNDPIVLAIIQGGYLIVTKWGDEENII